MFVDRVDRVGKGKGDGRGQGEGPITRAFNAKRGRSGGIIQFSGSGGEGKG